MQLLGRSGLLVLPLPTLIQLQSRDTAWNLQWQNWQLLTGDVALRRIRSRRTYSSQRSRIIAVTGLGSQGLTRRWGELGKPNVSFSRAKRPSSAAVWKHNCNENPIDRRSFPFRQIATFSLPFSCLESLDETPGDIIVSVPSPWADLVSTFTAHRAKKDWKKRLNWQLRFHNNGTCDYFAFQSGYFLYSSVSLYPKSICLSCRQNNTVLDRSSWQPEIFFQPKNYKKTQRNKKTPTCYKSS